MNKKNYLVIPIALLMCITFACLASATVTVVTPVAGTNISAATLLINCSYINGTDISNPTIANSSFSFNVTSTQVNFATYIGGGYGVSNNSIWVTVHTNEVPQGLGSINCLLGNTTSKYGYKNATVGRITLDSTKPVLSVKPTSTGSGRPFDYMCSDSIGMSTFTVTGPSGTVTSLTQSSSDYVSFSDTSTVGTYTFACTDYTGNVATQDVTVTSQGYSPAVTDQLTTQQSTGGLQLNTILLIGGVILVIYFFTRK